MREIVMRRSSHAELAHSWGQLMQVTAVADWEGSEEVEIQGPFYPEPATATATSLQPTTKKERVKVAAASCISFQSKSLLGLSCKAAAAATTSNQGWGSQQEEEAINVAAKLYIWVEEK